MRWLALALLAVLTVIYPQPANAADAARIVDMPAIRSAYLPPQHVRVWLPAGYDDEKRRYGVVYVQDGQWAFRADAKDDTTFFAIDESVTRLVRARRIKPVIIVAISNPGDDRFRQFIPQDIYVATTGDLRRRMDKELAGRPVTSTPFLKFISQELKPAIDRTYRTLPEPRHTTMIGASMGGLISAAAFVEHPESFGRAAFISPQWPLYDVDMIDFPELPKAWAAYFKRLGPPAGRKVWLEHGTTMIDAGMGAHQQAIVRQLKAMGWKEGINVQARVYQGGAHTPADWISHMDEMLSWLLK